MTLLLPDRCYLELGAGAESHTAGPDSRQGLRGRNRGMGSR